jgi:hypothetical protein
MDACHICSVSIDTRVCDICDNHACKNHHTRFGSPGEREYVCHDCNTIGLRPSTKEAIEEKEAERQLANVQTVHISSDFDFWYEELYGMMLDHDRFVLQYELLIQQFPDFQTFRDHFYERNIVSSNQYKFVDDKKYREFEKFVEKNNLSVSLKSVTHGICD